MKICIVSEAWNSINGVNTVYRNILDYLEKWEHDVTIVYPEMFKCINNPFYNELKVVINPFEVFSHFNNNKYDVIHISTEGTLGLCVRNYCVKNNLPFSSAYHTNFSDYLGKIFKINCDFVYKYLKWFHNKAEVTFIPTISTKNKLVKHGFDKSKLKIWTRGFDEKIFYPKNKCNKERILGYVGRVSVEKNLDAFLRLDIDGKKVVVGDGPYLKRLQNKYPDVEFTGYKFGEELNEQINRFDVFVFPSKTDTFGVVLIEAIACGIPVAAYPVEGPIDIIKNNETGYLHNDLKIAIEKAYNIPKHKVLYHKDEWSWYNCAESFLNNIKNYGQ